MRKVLSFVLVLTLVLSSFSMAFAATPATGGLTDIAGNPHADAIQVCYDLGIITGNPDGTFEPDKIVNRAEFAAMLTRALAIPDSALTGYTSTSFKDCAGYTWAVPYLAFCQSKGIMLGDGNGNVFPGRTITVNEAMTMALRAIGYTSNSSLLVGAWPANYVSIAQNEELYDDVTGDTTLNKAIAAQIIYNLLTVQKVSVNTDGSTDYLETSDGDAANLLNTNLGCEADEDVILGSANYDYGNTVINITGDIGAHGNAYLNDDGDVVAFTKDSTALTGSLNDDGDFEVGDVTYEFGTNTYTNAASYAAIANTEAKGTTAGGLTTALIASFAAVYADDGDTVTLNVDLSGKKIKDIYSVVGWKANDADLADSDVQDVITDDHELLTGSFVEDDDDAIDLTSFELVGVASLDKIAEDNVVAIYYDNSTDKQIRKVTVGTETLTGTIDEINADGDELTIGEKEYDVSSIKNHDTFTDSDVDSDGTFYLDVDGAVFSFDGTAAADTYGVVKASSAADPYDNMKIKLYTSEDSTKTLYLSEEDPYDIDWTTTSATLVTAGPVGVSAGALIGYSLNSDGQIDTIDNTVITTTGTLVFKSTKVLGSETIASNCVVFTYTATTSFGTFGTLTAGTDPADFDVAALGDIDAGTDVATATQPAFYILNDDGDVAAMFISDAFADTESDAVYGVINSRTATTTDGDNVYKFTGFIDGTAFTYKTDDRSNGGNHVSTTANAYDDLAGVFGVYAIIMDASNQITKINDLDILPYSIGARAGIIDSGIITDLGSDNTIVTIGSAKTSVADDAVVYLYDVDDEEFTVSKLSAIDEGDTIALYDTKDAEDVDGIATVVIYYEN